MSAGKNAETGRILGLVHLEQVKLSWASAKKPEIFMAQDTHHAHPPEVPPEMLAAHRAGWDAFTRAAFWNAVATAAVLVLLLLVFKVF
jgi:hypothetical protein